MALDGSIICCSITFVRLPLSLRSSFVPSPQKLRRHSARQRRRRTCLSFLLFLALFRRRRCAVLCSPSQLLRWASPPSRAVPPQKNVLVPSHVRDADAIIARKRTKKQFCIAPWPYYFLFCIHILKRDRCEVIKTVIGFP